MRLIYSPLFSTAHWLGVAVALALVAPLVSTLIREYPRPGDARRSVVLAGLLLALVLTVVATAQAAAFPYNPCPVCKEFCPDWYCTWMYDCK